MEKKIDIVFFCNLSDMHWSEDTNYKLNEILKDLDVTLAKTLGYEVEVNTNGSQTIKTLERPAFSNQSRGLNITFIDDRIDFRFVLNETENIKPKLKECFSYLEDIVEKFSLDVKRIGVNCEQLSNNKFDLQKYYLPLNKENIIEFGIKQARQENLKSGSSEILLNVLTVLQKTKDENNFILDFNTIYYESGIDKSIRSDFLKKIENEMDTLYEQLLKIAKGE